MANSDYTARALALPFCPAARLADTITRLQTVVTMTGYTSPIPNGIRLGMAAMIDNEIVSVLNRSGNTLTLGRGCCDTVPAAHAADAVIYFFDDSVGTDGVEYGATETIGVKVLPRTNSGGAVAISAAPPNALTMNWRFARPYPPGLVKVNGNRWFNAITLNNSTPAMVLTWAHRDRVTQQDQLIDHEQASIGPEVGVTYRVQVRKFDGTLVRTFEAIEGATFTYSWISAIFDWGVSSGTYAGYLTLAAVRGSLESFQAYRIDFSFDGAGMPRGLGYRLGESLGGI